MGRSEEIERAIAAHGIWKQRLLVAIGSGASEFSVEQAQADNLCDFGRWFYGLDASKRQSEQGQKIQQLHAAFHAEAARILEMALQGHKFEALQALTPGSRYATLSGQLAIALVRWKTA